MPYSVMMCGIIIPCKEYSVQMKLNTTGINRNDSPLTLFIFTINHHMVFGQMIEFTLLGARSIQEISKHSNIPVMPVHNEWI